MPKGPPWLGSAYDAERWSGHVQSLDRAAQEGGAGLWYMVMFLDKTGRGEHSQLLVLSSPVGSVILGKHWAGAWKLTPWPQDLDIALFRKAFESRRALAAYADSIDSALAGLSRAVRVADVRRIRTRLGDAPRGQSWDVLKSIVRAGVDASLEAALRGYADVDRGVLLPWLRQQPTRPNRVHALQEMPVALRTALLLNTGCFEFSSCAASAGQRLLLAVDSGNALELHACELLGLSREQHRWVNQVGGSPQTPAHLLADLCAILAHLPPQIRPQSHADLLQKRPLIKLASAHNQVLFSPELTDRLDEHALKAHRLAFHKSCAPLLKRAAPWPGDAPKSRSVVDMWLSELDDTDFVAAHQTLCAMSFAKRERLFLALAESAESPVHALPVFIDAVARRAEQVWTMPARSDGSALPLTQTSNPQRWAAGHICDQAGVVLSWPTSPNQLKRIGLALHNCLAGPHGREFWLDIVTGQQVLVVLSSKVGPCTQESLLALSISQCPENTVKAAIEQHFGARNTPPPIPHSQFAQQLRAEIEGELRASACGSLMLARQESLRALTEHLAKDLSGWRSRQIDALCRAAVLPKAAGAAARHIDVAATERAKDGSQR